MRVTFASLHWLPTAITALALAFFDELRPAWLEIYIWAARLCCSHIDRYLIHSRFLPTFGGGPVLIWRYPVCCVMGFFFSRSLSLCHDLHLNCATWEAKNWKCVTCTMSCKWSGILRDQGCVSLWKDPPTPVIWHPLCTVYFSFAAQTETPSVNLFIRLCQLLEEMYLFQGRAEGMWIWRWEDGDGKTDREVSKSC